MVASTPWELPHKLEAKWQGPFKVSCVPNVAQVECARDCRIYVASIKTVKRYIQEPVSTEVSVHPEEIREGPGQHRHPRQGQ